MKVVEIIRSAHHRDQPLPAFLSRVQAGFPSPAEDYVEKELDLNDMVVKHPTSTFFVKVEGSSMEDAGIHSGDILVVDRSLVAKHGTIVIATLNGEFTVKRFILEKDRAFLAPENPNFPKIEIDPDSDFQVWGVVTYVIHDVRFS